MISINAIIALVVVILIAVVMAMITARFFYRAEPPRVLIVFSPRLGHRVISSGRVFVTPLIPRCVEQIDIVTTSIQIDPSESEVVDKEGLRFCCRLLFDLRVTRDPDDLLRVLRVLGPWRLTDPEALKAYFSPLVLGTTKNKARGLILSDRGQQERLFDEVSEWIQQNLSGFTLERLVIDNVRLIS